MKKLSKSKRKKQKEQHIRREAAMKRAGEPFSKHPKKPEPVQDAPEVCHHYQKDGIMNAIGGDVKFVSLLKKTADADYVCQKCGRIFSKNQQQRLEELCRYLEEPLSEEEKKKELQDFLDRIPRVSEPPIMPIWNSYSLDSPRLRKICEVDAIIDRELNGCQTSGLDITR